MGYPLWYVLGSSTPSLSNGVVAKGTGINEDPSTFQLTAKINKGNSGGPVFDMYGNLIGITMGKLDNEEIRKTDGQAPEDINFAIHVDRLNKPLNMKLTSVGVKDRPMLKPEDIYQMMVGKVVIVAVALN
jgi:S1-C subfamily serine protease